MLTVGYGDIHAISNDEKIGCMFSMVLASTFFGYIIGTLSSLMEKKNAVDDYFREVLLAANAYISKHRLPGELRYRIRSSLNYLHELDKKNSAVDPGILEYLSDPLRREIALFTNGPLLKKCIPILRLFDESIISTLSTIMEEISLAPSDIIFKEGEASRSLYFLVDGTVSLYLERSGMQLEEIEPVMYFGEVGFFTGRPRTCSARTESFVSLLVIHYPRARESLSKLEHAQQVFEAMKNGKDTYYAIFGISCYLCRGKGHVAIDCKKRYRKQPTKLKPKKHKVRKVRPLDETKKDTERENGNQRDYSRKMPSELNAAYNQDNEWIPRSNTTQGQRSKERTEDETFSFLMTCNPKHLSKLEASDLA